MIDWKKSAELNNETVGELKAYFERFPGSGKKIVAICDNPECGNPVRILVYQAYRDLCQPCIFKNDDRNKKIRDNHVDVSGDKHPMYGKKHSPEAIEKNKRAHLGENNSRYKISHTDKSIEKMRQVKLKQYAEMDNPGQQICMHHYIYDFDDLDKYRIPVTRSEHKTIHNNLKATGLEVPCINIMVDD